MSWGGVGATCDVTATGASSPPSTGPRYYLSATSVASGKVDLAQQSSMFSDLKFVYLTWLLVHAFVFELWKEAFDKVEKRLLPRFEVRTDVSYHAVCKAFEYIDDLVSIKCEISKIFKVTGFRCQ